MNMNFNKCINKSIFRYRPGGWSHLKKRNDDKTTRSTWFGLGH